MIRNTFMVEYAAPEVLVVNPVCVEISKDCAWHQIKTKFVARLISGLLACNASFAEAEKKYLKVFGVQFSVFSFRFSENAGML